MQTLRIDRKDRKDTFGHHLSMDPVYEVFSAASDLDSFDDWMAAVDSLGEPEHPALDEDDGDYLDRKFSCCRR